MESMDDIINKPYQAAVPDRKIDTYELLILTLSVIWDVLRVIILSIPSYIELLTNLFVSPPKKNVEGQVVLITGAGNGIGREMALQFAKEKCYVAIADIDLKAAQKTVDDLNKLSIKAKAYCVDVADLNAVNDLRWNIEKDLGFVDILINNAGVMPLLSILDGTGTEIDRIFKVNAISMYYTARVFLPGMLNRKRGHIVAISSLSALYAIPIGTIYGASKFAVDGIIEGLAEQLRYDGYDYIRTTIVYPYFVSSRKDLMDCVNLRFPAITPKQTAEIAVDGILRNYRTVTAPTYHKLFLFISRFCTYETINYFKYYVIHDKKTFVKNYK